MKSFNLHLAKLALIFVFIAPYAQSANALSICSALTFTQSANNNNFNVQISNMQGLLGVYTLMQSAPYGCMNIQGSPSGILTVTATENTAIQCGNLPGGTTSAKVNVNATASGITSCSVQ